MILLNDDEILATLTVEFEEDAEDLRAIAKAQLKKVEDWLRTLLDDPELEEHKGVIGFIGLTIHGELLKEIK